MAERWPFEDLAGILPPERQAWIKATAVRLTAQQNDIAAERDDIRVREREAVLDELVADAQENDMGYRAPAKQGDVIV